MPRIKGDAANTFLKRYNAGIQTFRRLFTHWMDTNRWSHPVMIKLTKSCLEGAVWLHSSQISAIRTGELLNPGPRTFIAIAELNKAIHIYKTTKKLLPGTTTDLEYLHAYAITQDGEAPGPDWWYAVFIGYAHPENVPFDVVFYNDIRASEFSERFGRLIRQLLVANGHDIFTDLDRALYRYYPAGDASRVSKLKDVILNKTVWTATEAELELAALAALTSELDGPTTTEELLTQVG